MARVRRMLVSSDPLRQIEGRVRRGSAKLAPRNASLRARRRTLGDVPPKRAWSLMRARFTQVPAELLRCGTVNTVPGARRVEEPDDGDGLTLLDQGRRAISRATIPP